MSSLSAKDRVSLCSFTFADGRQCRTPRSAGHPHLCSDHARKDSQARAADKLARDLSYFFSGEYLSACDLTAALGRLIVSVARGDIKPRSARTLAYLAQTLVQTIHLAQDEYINAFDTDAWRRAVRNSVKGNHDYLFPPAPKPEQPAAAPSNAPQPAPSTHAPIGIGGVVAHSPLPHHPACGSAPGGSVRSSPGGPEGRFVFRHKGFAARQVSVSASPSSEPVKLSRS